MTNWIKLEKGDNYLELIKGKLGPQSSLHWPGGTTAHAWLDLDTSNWIVVHAEQEQLDAADNGGTVVTYVHLEGQDAPLTFSKRLRAHFNQDRLARDFGTDNFDAALAAVAAEAARVLSLPAAD